jgi:ferrous iron transport protein B
MNGKNKKINIALAGNANVGKSVIFNTLTGLHQHIGNWPGKTVERAEGTLYYKGYTIDVIDLPGIYSLSTFSIEEQVSREYIAIERPDAVINVIASPILERNLYFTIQLIELGVPVVIALNQIDIAEKAGIEINQNILSTLLGVPVVKTIATKELGVHELLDKVIEIVEGKTKVKPKTMYYPDKIERKIRMLSEVIEKAKQKQKQKRVSYPSRYIAIKLLEEDSEMKRIMERIDGRILKISERYAREIEKEFGTSSAIAIASARYGIASKIAAECQKRVAPKKPTPNEQIDNLTMHPILGYIIAAIVLFGIFYVVFGLGGALSEFIEGITEGIRPTILSLFGSGPIGELIYSALESLFAALAIVLPFILPFYFILNLLEDSGYLTRVAFLMDAFMHRIGLHGKAIIPIILGYGCNVPACLGCRIMETDRERFLAAFVTTFIPCAARTVIILGLVGKFLGIHWAIAMYAIDIVLIIILGRIAFRVFPGEPTGLIMEMHPYKLPDLKTVTKQTWFRVQDFMIIAFPLIIVTGIVIKAFEIFGLLEQIAGIMAPITVGWLGLPIFAGVLLIFGILRKELALTALAALSGTTDFSLVMSPIQMVVFTLVMMLYIPCISTIAALAKEFGWKKALSIALFEIVFAILVGGIAFRFLIYLL